MLIKIDMEVTVLLFLEGFMAEMLVNIGPENYYDKLVIEGGKKVIYTTLLKGFYGTLVSKLIF